MFYVDFNSPEGKTYRIDLSKNLITYECPICGELKQCILNEDELKLCDACNKKEEEERALAERERSYEQLANYVNKIYKSNLSGSFMKTFCNDPENIAHPHESIKALISQLEKNRPKKKLPPIERDPRVVTIPRPNNV